MTDFGETQVLKVITPVGNQIPAIHKACIFHGLLFEVLFRKGMLQVSEISFKTRQTGILDGVIVVMPVFDIIPFAIFRMISVPAPGSGFICFADKTADEIQLPPFQILFILRFIADRVRIPAFSCRHYFEAIQIQAGKPVNRFISAVFRQMSPYPSFIQFHLITSSNPDLSIVHSKRLVLRIQ